MPHLLNRAAVSDDPEGNASWLSLEVEYVGDDARLIREAASRSGRALDDTVRSLSCAAAAGSLTPGPRHLFVFLAVGVIGLILGLVAPSVAHAVRQLAALRLA